MIKSRVLQGIVVACILTTLAVTPVSSDDLLKTDFQEESFAKIVDYLDYARALALLHGLPQIPNYWHAHVYMTYVNKMGLKMLYAGLCNVSLADQIFFTIPMQTLLMHYKTENNQRDALVASNFLMLMGFNDTAESIYPDSPDRNDTLWASFSFGANLKQVFPNATFPAFNSKCEVFPLTTYDDGLTWKWGMRYTNLTALWITTYITEDNETDTSRPWGLATYDELTFNYTLSIDPNKQEATIAQDHVIGRMRDLWTFWGWFLVPLYNHYNSTGCYRYGEKVSDETVYEFLRRNDIKMSIVEFQTSVMLDRDTYSTSSTGENVTDNEVIISDSISTYADDGEKIFEASFGVKQTYNLLDYTEDSKESTPHSFNTTTRTTEIDGYARNRDLFNFHRNFARYFSLILVHIYPELYERAKETITNMTRADYLFLISYPNYSGYRIEHDPTFTVYFTASIPPAHPYLLILLIVATAAVAIAIAVFIRRRKPGPPKFQTAMQQLTS